MRFFYLLIILLSLHGNAYAQGNFILKNKASSHKIKFELINNLIVFPVEVNGVELSFLLDTGVSKPIIFNSLQGIDKLQVNDSERIFLRGLGGGKPVEAIKSRKNLLKIGEALNVNQTLYVIFDTSMDFAPRLGVPVHGIMGYDIFKDFVVELNYSAKYIKLHDPKQYKAKACKKCEFLNLDFYNLKPYLNAEIDIENIRIPVKLLIDTGGSDALWLFEDSEKGITFKDNNYFEDFLGNGLSGSIYGKRSKIAKLHLKKFVFENVNVAYPDSSSIHYARKFVDRSGSISGELLKRFNLIFDYKAGTLSIRKNGNFKTPFSYNKSGISIEYGDVRLVKEKDRGGFSDGRNHTSGNQASDNIPIIVVTTYKYSFKPAFTIVELRNDSPAHKVGIKIEDIILSINNKESHTFTLQEMLRFFYGKDGKRIRLKIDRNGTIMNFVFNLESALKQKSSSN